MLQNLTLPKSTKFAVLAAISAALFSGVVSSAPTGGNISAGSGSISNPGNGAVTVNQVTDNMVIDWQTFNVGAQESINFIQPGQDAAVLNNIHDQNPSQIFGAITANGKVFLSNPNGIIFGAGSTVNVGALVATTHQLSTEDFMNKEYVLVSQNGDGLIVNRGILAASSGGSIVLVGDQVSNEGVIRADAGRVVLASGDVVTLDFDGDGLIKFTVDGDSLSTAGGTLVNNDGDIIAEGGEVYLTGNAAAGVFDKVVNNSGLIVATKIDNRGGVISLLGNGGDTYNSGTLLATSQDGVGGDVDVLGERVALVDGSLIDVSGLNGGGNIRVGGDYQGKNSAVKNGSDTFVSDDSTLRADATISGDGGRVIVWADDVTVFQGEISAKGGAESGDGGFVEVSGKEFLVYKGHTDTTAANGEKGMLLLDPRNVDISVAPTTDLGGGGTIANNDSFADNPGGTSNINNSQLASAVASSNVTIQAHDDITVYDEISVTSANTLTLEAGDDVIVNDAIRITGGGISIISGSASATPVLPDGTSDIVLNDVLVTGSGTVTLNTNGGNIVQNSVAVDAGTVNYTTGGGGLTVTNGNITGGTFNANTGGGAITQAGGTIDVTNLTLDSGGGTLDFNGGVIDATSNFNVISNGGNVSQNAGTITAGTVSATTNGGSFTQVGGTIDATNLTLDSAGGSVSQTTGIINATALTVTNNGGTTNLSAGVNDFGSASLTGGTFTIKDKNAIDFGASSVTGTLNVEADGDITDSGTLSVAGNANINAAGFNVTLDDAANTFATMSVEANELTVAEAGSVDFGTTTITGNFSVTAGGSVTDSGAVTVGGSTSINATGFDIVLDAPDNDFNDLSLVGSNAVIVDVNDVVMEASTLSGDFTLTAGGNVTDIGTLTIAGTTTLNVEGNDVTFDDAANDFGTVSATVDDLLIVDTNAIDFGVSTITGNLDVTAGGDVSDSGTITVEGITTIDATGFDITLDDTSNDFNSVALLGKDAILVDRDNIDFADSTLTGGLTLTAGGDVTDSGTLSIAGLADITASGFDVIFDNTANDFGAFSVIANNAEFHDINDVEIGDLNLSENLLASVLGDMTDLTAGTISIGGLAAVTSGLGNITIGGTDDTTNIGRINFQARLGAINYQEDSDTLIEGIQAKQISVESAGTIHVVSSDAPVIAETDVTLIARGGEIGTPKTPINIQLNPTGNVFLDTGWAGTSTVTDATALLFALIENIKVIGRLESVHIYQTVSEAYKRVFVMPYNATSQESMAEERPVINILPNEYLRLNNSYDLVNSQEE